MPPIDRICTWLGAGRIVRRRAGMGWMLVEFFPVAVWSRITGAINLENSFYLVGYLTLLGASKQDRAWVMGVYGAAVVLQSIVVLRRRSMSHADAKRFCVRDSWIARTIAAGSLLWPWIAFECGLSKWWGLGGFFIGTFFSQFIFFTGLAAWTTWTQDLVDKDLRGPFFAWRNISGIIAIALVTILLSVIWPDVPPAEEQVWWYAALFSTVSLINIAATDWLARAPTGPGADAEKADDPPPQLPPLRTVLADAGPFWRYAGWNALNGMAMACTLMYTPDLILAAGFVTEDFAFFDFAVRTPVALFGLLVAGALLHRIGAHRMMFGMCLSLILGISCYLGAAPLQMAWLVPVGIGLEGLGRSLTGIGFMARLYEVVPRGDQRLPALFMGIGALAMTTTAILVSPGLSVIKAWWPQLEPGWLLVAVGVGIRILAVPLILDSRTLEDRPTDQAAD